MALTRTHPVDSPCEAALAEVSATGAALSRVRQGQAQPAQVRVAFTKAADALDAAVSAARASGRSGRPLVRELLTARDLLILTRRDTDGMNVPDCAQPASLDADGPETSGLEFEAADPHGPPGMHMHGLNLSAALEPSTRGAAGQAGPHANRGRQRASRWAQEPAPESARP